MSKYNWSNISGMKYLLRRVYLNTMANLNNKDEVRDLMINFEDYLHTLQLYNYDLNEVVYRLHDLKSFNLASKMYINNESVSNERKAITYGGNLVINDQVNGNELLNKKERIRLNQYVGLSHMLINIHNIDSEYFASMYNNIIDFGTVKPEFIIYNGWQLLENILSEQLGETVAYTTVGLKRPNLRKGIEKNDYFPIDDELVVSNLEQYRMFEYIVPMLSKTLNGIGNKEEDNDVVLSYNMLKLAINNNLSRYIIKDYTSHNNHFELYSLLYLMGILEIEKESILGIRPVPELKLTKDDSATITKLIKELLTAELVLNNDKFNEPNDINSMSTDKSEFVKARLKKLITERNI